MLGTRFKCQFIHRFLQMVRGEVSVDHGCLDVGVAHELLDRGQVDTVHDKMAGEGVTQGVKFGQAFDTGFFGDFDQPFAKLGFDLTPCGSVGENKITLNRLVIICF